MNWLVTNTYILHSNSVFNHVCDQKFQLNPLYEPGSPAVYLGIYFLQNILLRCL